MANDLILIVGGRGTVGSELGRILRAQGAKVRITTSQKVAASDELVPVNLLTGDGLCKAFDGVDKAFFLSPPGTADQYSVLSPLIQEAKRRGLKKVVLMTAMGANANDSTPFRRAEIELEKSGLTYNIIRPNWFLQNFHTFWAHGINTANEIALPAGTAKTSFIDARDISEVAAKLLISSEFDNQDFDLTGPEALTHAEVAVAISKVAGRKITYRDAKPEELKKTLLGFGLAADYVDFMLLIFGFLKEGYSAGVSKNVKKITDREPRNLNTYINDHQKNWKK